MELLAEHAADLGLSLSVEQLGQFARLQDLLQEWNQRINLTAIDDPRGIQLRHFLDSLTCTLATGNLNGKSLVDVGTGAGFPGLPLKILYPYMRLTLIESVTKKTRFLHTVVRELALEEVTIIDRRAETVAHEEEHRAGYDWAVARAVAELRVLIEYLLPFCRLGGHALAMKSDSAHSEAEEAGQALQILGGGPPHFHPVQLPGQKDTYYLVVIEKNRETPAKYPRRPGRPAKRPL